MIQIIAVISDLWVIAHAAEVFRYTVDPDWIYYPPLAEENERKRQETLKDRF